MEQIARQVMSLPMYPDLSEADQDRIVSAIAPGQALNHDSIR
jgi:dTDP-4-amino-4,6-dideoxygalactose transaminase